MTPPDWLERSEGEAPLIVSIPHTGLDLAGLDDRLVSVWGARRDADWHIERLYDFAGELGATVIRTRISRTVIDVNRDPSGQSLYPGQATTELCPTTSFDGDPLYKHGQEPSGEEIARRKATYFEPYHAALHAEIARLRARHAKIVVHDCHSIRSLIPRLFDGLLPHFNIGTNSGASAAPELEDAIRQHCLASGRDVVSNGRFKGGFITRSLGTPETGVHAVQMELACRGYLPEIPGPVSEANWPPAYDPVYAGPIRDTLRAILTTALDFAHTP
jgi:formiminoglutamase